MSSSLFRQIACDDSEQWLWDLCGYMVIKGVMDPDWLAAANEAVDAMERDTGSGDAAAVATVDAAAYFMLNAVFLYNVSPKTGVNWRFGP